MNIQIKVLNKNATVPQISTSGAAGVDLRAMFSEEKKIMQPNETMLIPTGLAIYIKDKNYVGLILPRSGIGHKYGIILGNGTGVIDSDYQGELMVSLWNRSNQEFVIKKADRIAQLIVVPVVQPNFIEVEEFELSNRGANGFGSTGIK